MNSLSSGHNSPRPKNSDILAGMGQSKIKLMANISEFLIKDNANQIPNINEQVFDKKHVLKNQ